MCNIFSHFMSLASTFSHLATGVYYVKHRDCGLLTVIQVCREAGQNTKQEKTEQNMRRILESCFRTHRRARPALIQGLNSPFPKAL